MLADTLGSVPLPSIIAFHVIALLVSWTILNSVSLLLVKPRGISVFGRGLACGKWLSTLEYLFCANEIISTAYKKSNRRPFAVVALRTYQILVSRIEHIQEISRAPERILSNNAAIKDRIEHSAIMSGFSHDNKFDMDGAVTIRAVKVLLRESIPKLRVVMDQKIDESFESVLRQRLRQQDTISAMPVFAFAKAILVHPALQVLYGDRFDSDPSFEKETLKYWWDGAYAAALCEVLPKSIAPYVGRLFMEWRGSMPILGHKLDSLVAECLAASADSGVDREEKLDIAHFIVESSRLPGQRDPIRLRQLFIALNFTFAHQPTMALAWALIDLGQHREYIELLREEISRAEEEGHHDITGNLPLMECFLRESSRLHPLDGLTAQRKALKPFTLSDGTHIPVGTLVAVPQQAILQDPANYDDPKRFNAFRFYSKDTTGEAVQKWTDVNFHYPVWGSPARPCPGRWFASWMLKQVLVHFLKNYEFNLLDSANCKAIRWTTAIAPRLGIQMSVRARKV